MGHSDTILFLLQLAVMLATAVLFGRLAQLIRLPAVIGEIVGGIFLGPTIFGNLSPAFFYGLFPNGGLTGDIRDSFIKLGLLFFLFTTGLEVNLELIKKRSKAVIMSSIFGIAVPFIVGYGSVIFLPRLWKASASGNISELALFIGTALSITALPVIARILIEVGLINTEIGMVVLASATVNDIVGWGLFAVLISSVAPENALFGNFLFNVLITAGIFIFFLTIGRRLGIKALNWIKSRAALTNYFVSLTSVIMLAAAAIAEAAGIHAIFGAFLTGIALSNTSGGDTHLYDRIRQFVVSFFAPLYFVSLGLKADFSMNFSLPLVLTVFLIACLGKLAGGTLGASLGGMNLKDSFTVSIGMNARGAMEIIIASIALDYHIIGQPVYVALVIMALGTTLISGPLMQYMTHMKNAESL